MSYGYDGSPHNFGETMANQTSFDLNAAIHDWRAGLAKSSSFHVNDLDELESHVRDSVETLRAQGLTGEEACLIAIRRTGRREVIAAEFAAIDGSSVWLDRLLWMAVGWITVPALLSVILMLTVRRPLSFLPPVLASAVLALALIFGLQSTLLKKPLKAPFVFGAGFLLLTSFVLLLGAGSVSDVLEGFSYVLYNLNFSAQCLVTALLITLFAFKRMRPGSGGATEP